MLIIPFVKFREVLNEAGTAYAICIGSARVRGPSPALWAPCL